MIKAIRDAKNRLIFFKDTSRIIYYSSLSENNMGTMISRTVACIHFLSRNPIFAIYSQENFKTTLVSPATDMTQ